MEIMTLENDYLVQKLLNSLDILNKRGKYRFVVGIVKDVYNIYKENSEVVFVIYSKKDKELYRAAFKDYIANSFKKINDFLYYNSKLEVVKFETGDTVFIINNKNKINEV